MRCNPGSNTCGPAGTWPGLQERPCPQQAWLEHVAGFIRLRDSAKTLPRILALLTVSPNPLLFWASTCAADQPAGPGPAAGAVRPAVRRLAAVRRQCFSSPPALPKSRSAEKGKSLLKVLSMADFLPASETRLPAGHTDNTRSGPHTRRTLPVGNPGCHASGGVPCVRTSARSPTSVAGQSCATALPLLASPREWHSRARPRRTTRRRNEGSDSAWVPPRPADRGSRAGRELVLCLRPRAA